MNVYKKYFGGKHLAVLLDPDKTGLETAKKSAAKIEKSPVDLIFVGGSLVSNSVDSFIKTLKNETEKPIVLFPGSGSQFSEKADALLFLSLISGRNPEYLIGEHVKWACTIKKTGIEVIPTGYILIDGGKTTSVEYISNTMPIPADKTDLAVATAVAGELCGLKCLYLEAGSGAINPVSAETISAVRQNVDIPIITGGGIRSLSAANKAFNAGANIIVIGTAFEQNPDFFSQQFIV